MRFDAEPTRTVVADDDIQIIRLDARKDFDLRRVLILQGESRRGVLALPCQQVRPLDPAGAPSAPVISPPAHRSYAASVRSLNHLPFAGLRNRRAERSARARGPQPLQ